MITDNLIDKTFTENRPVCGGVRNDYFGVVYLEHEYKVPRDKVLNQVGFGGNDFGFDGFHFDESKGNLYIFQFKYSSDHTQFKNTLQRLIEDGMEQVFVAPNKNDSKNQILLQLRSCLINNREVIKQVCFHFVFTGDPQEAERSRVLDKLREDLENKKYLIDQFFGERKVGFVVEFRSSSGRVGVTRAPRHTTTFEIPLKDLVVEVGPTGQKMHLGFIRLADLNRIHLNLGPCFFDSNIRYGLDESEAVNRAISAALKQIIIDRTEDPSVFAFNHNGISLFAEHVHQLDGLCRLTAPRLLNGAQTVTTLAGFIAKNKDNPKLAEGKEAYESIRVLCRVITDADQKFVTNVTINNNRQNPVEPWNLHANDIIQLELQDRFQSDLQIYYERQENAFDQLSVEDLENIGIREESKAIQMLKLTQAFLLTDGLISRLSEMRRVFEDTRVYDQVFRRSRLEADFRHILLCYKVQFRLRKLISQIEEKGYNKYQFVYRARNLLWALICQGILNDDKLEDLAENYGRDMSVPAGYTESLGYIATARARILLSELMKDRDYQDKIEDDNLSFLRTDRAFEKCMAIAHKKWGWEHIKLSKQ